MPRSRAAVFAVRNADVPEAGNVLLHPHHTMTVLRGPLTRGELERAQAERMGQQPPRQQLQASPNAEASRTQDSCDAVEGVANSHQRGLLTGSYAPHTSTTSAGNNWVCSARTESTRALQPSVRLPEPCWYAAAPHSPVLTQLPAFVRGFTPWWWVTATWWIPMLVILALWRHVFRKFPLNYDPQYWGVVFPIGMYTVGTLRLSHAVDAPYLADISRVFVYIALLAWSTVAITTSARRTVPNSSGSPSPTARRKKVAQSTSDRDHI